ncbi:MAG TPA: peptidase S10 [Beijerinckiaceae bacterium]
MPLPKHLLSRFARVNLQSLRFLQVFGARTRRGACGSALLLALLGPVAAQVAPAPAPAQEAGPAAQPREAPRGARPGAGERPQGETRRLPPDAVTRHVVELPGRTLRFTATAGSLPLVDGQGNVQAEIGYVSYTLDGAEPASRPVTFAVNGGPGASSAYLHLGVLGPWRLPLDGTTISPSAPPTLVPNAETWLDFTDLVFIDPIGSGYSRANGSDEDIRNRYYTVEGDIDTLSAVVSRWLRTRERLPSPKFYVGESYGGFRGPLLAEKLQGDIGVAFSGLVLVSPVLDFAWLSAPRHAPWLHMARLPSLAAACLERKGTLAREALRDAEAYAAGEYLGDLLRGLQDPAVLERMSGRVAELVCLDRELVRRVAGRVDVSTFQREFARASGRVVSAYDTAITAQDPDPTAATPRFEDPGLTTLTAPLTSAIVDHLARSLNWRVPDQRYQLLNGQVNGAWRWSRGRSQPEALSNLRRTLALDGKLRTLVVHGFTDLVTPYFANQILLNQLTDFGPGKRVGLNVYPGGHMFYFREDGRAAFRGDAMRLYREALEARQNDKAP